MGDALLTRASLLARLGDPLDRAAWQQFVELYGSLVYGFARQRGLQDADAVNQTAVQLDELLPGGRPLALRPPTRLISCLALRPDTQQNRQVPSETPRPADRQRRQQRPPA